MLTPSSLAYRYGSSPQIRMHMSLPAVKTDPCTERRVRLVFERIVGRKASSSGSTCGITTEAAGVGGADDRRGDGLGSAVLTAVGTGVLVGSTRGLGDGLSSASWFGLSVADGDGTGDPTVATEQAATVIDKAIAAHRIVLAFIWVSP
jgi:hypothetical protein